MLKYIFALAILIGGLFSTANAQTTLLQSLVDATPRCGTLTLPSDVVYPGGAVIRRCINIRSVGTRTVESKRGNFQVGAKILTTTPDPAITILPGVDGVSIEGVEIAPTGFVYDLVRIGEKSSAQDTTEEEPRNISLKNVWIHGLPDQDSQRGVSANGKYISITNSKISDIHGVGYDTQAILVYNGSGPFLIADNELQAAGENIMFGGADPAISHLVPSDIQILRNYVWKPLSWKVGDPSYAGKHWTVKNLLELKNARNVVIDGNVFENNWTDGQAGVAILFTVRNQECTAPWSTVQNVTFTNNTVRNSDGGALNFLGKDNEAEPGYIDPQTGKPKCGDPGETFGSIRGSPFTGFNNLFYDIGGSFITLNGFDNVSLDHNTDPLRHWNLATIYGQPSRGFRYTKNLTFDHEYGIWSEDGKRVGDPSGLTPDGVIEQNVVVAPHDKSSWPTNNLLIDSLILPPDFRSPFVDVGADIDLLNAAQGGASTPLPSPTPTPTPTPEPEPLPSPSPLVVSPNNTRLPPATQIVDAGFGVWTMSGTTIFRNGISTGGQGSLVLWYGGNVYAIGTDGNWWLYLGGSNWTRVAGDPSVPAPTPSPTPEASPSPTPAPSPSPSPTPTPVPDPTPAPSPSPSPTPTPTPSPSATPCPKGWIKNGKCRNN